MLKREINPKRDLDWRSIKILKKIKIARIFSLNVHIRLGHYIRGIFQADTPLISAKVPLNFTTSKARLDFGPFYNKLSWITT